MKCLCILNKTRCYKILKENVSFHSHLKEKFKNKYYIYFKDLHGFKIFLEMRLSYFILESVRLLFISLDCSLQQKLVKVANITYACIFYFINFKL